jgi:hypothetical protein
VLALLLGVSSPVRGQTIDDGILMTRHSLQAGGIVTHDRWEEYWEGTLKRVNGNIGTLTTRASTWSAAFGLTDRLTLFGSVPFVWTRPSMGVLQGQSGLQDLMLGAKYSFLERASPRRGTLRALGALSTALPLSDYTPDFAPLSIGTQSRRVSGRLTLNYQTARGVYVNGSTARTWRGDVTLDRPYFFTEDRLSFSDTVPMPAVSDSVVSVGYLTSHLNTNAYVSRQITHGGGDIRRQDMPFVSNRMNATKVGGMAMYAVPRMRNVALYAAMARTLDGRNVGQATTVALGVLYSRGSQGRLIR